MLATLQRACDGNLSGEFAAVVTGPVHRGSSTRRASRSAVTPNSSPKAVRHRRRGDAAGHRSLRVALATTHIPLAYVAMAITQERLGR